MNILVDTNLLTRSAQPGHIMHAAAVAAVKSLLIKGETLCLAPQNFYEFWVVATRSPAENGMGFTVSQTHAELQRIKRLFSTLPDVPALFAEWERLVVQHEIKGKQAHDARLVASMIVHGVPAILTFDVSDFARYPNITVLDPREMAPA